LEYLPFGTPVESSKASTDVHVVDVGSCEGSNSRESGVRVAITFHEAVIGPNVNFGTYGRSFICASGGAFEPAPSTSANRRFRLTQNVWVQNTAPRASKSGSPPLPVADYDKLLEKPGYHFNRMAAWNESSAVCELWFLVNKPKPIYRTRSRHLSRGS
jgi:hypothetical protein